MRNKFEQLVEYIVNDENEKAQELFHNIVVEKSRNIYQDLVAEAEEEESEEEIEETSEEEEVEESWDEDMEEAGNMSMDSTDDMMGDVSADEEGMDGVDDADMGDMDDMDHMGGEEGEEGDVEDRITDLEDSLDELKAEFERLMADEAGEEEHSDMGDEEQPEEGVMREYVEKVKDFYKGDNSEGSPVGSTNSSPSTTNSKSIVASKNDMGGTAQNIAKGDKGVDPDGKTYSKPSNQYSKGAGNLKGAGSFENVPGAKAGKAFANAKKPVSSEVAGTNDKSILKKA